MKIYTIEKQQNGDMALLVNGQHSICPFKTGAPIQNNLGQVAFMNQSCNNSCPLFKSGEETIAGETIIEVLCGCKPREIVIKKEENNQPKLLKV